MIDGFVVEDLLFALVWAELLGPDRAQITITLSHAQHSEVLEVSGGVGEPPDWLLWRDGTGAILAHTATGKTSRYDSLPDALLALRPLPAALAAWWRLGYRPGCWLELPDAMRAPYPSDAYPASSRAGSSPR